ncbi:MAG: Mo-dependent nitrogenase C-terminal domain-containing protein [Cyanobacteria bacterium SBC]|nr:Mo-dependent nitrogenase C-terminal domain-containing protein [Cyanobacteria bacterium SBC]
MFQCQMPFPRLKLQIPFNGDLLAPLRQWLDELDVRRPHLAQAICQLVPAQCPFARDIYGFDRVLFSIPPLCKLNPLYNELMSLRFRALCYLEEEFHSSTIDNG